MRPLAATESFAAQARWIWHARSNPNQWVAFRKSFTLGSTPTTAPTRIAADTHYWLYVNGRLVVFEGGAKRGPNPSDSYVDNIDLAPYLNSGRNTVAVLVWHLGRSGFSHQSSGAGGLLLQSDIGTPGGTVRLVSDSSWKQVPFAGYRQDTTGTQPNFRLSEWNISYDARLAAAMTGWTMPGYDDSAWPAAIDRGLPGVPPWNRLVARGTPLHRFSGLMPYVNQSNLPRAGTGGTIAAMLPTNLQITPYLRVDAPPGQTITIQTDQYMDGGEPNVRATYVTTGGVQEFEALGWMSGTRVLYTVPPGVTILALQYRESGYDTGFAGSFTSNDPFFDTLWAKLQRTVYLNMRDTFMDCPTRERAAWWGDIAVNLQATPYMFDERVDALINKNIEQLVGSQRPSGAMFSPYPAGSGIELPQQMLAAIAAFATHYQHSGDARALGPQTYQAVKRYMNLWSFDGDGLIRHRAGDWDWADWGSHIDARVLDNAWYVKALDATMLLARLNGQTADIAGWQARRATIAANFDRVLWNSAARAYRSPGYSGDTDDRANALAVSAGLAKPANHPDIAQVLRGHHNASPYLETHVIEALYLMRRPIEAQDRLIARYAPQVNDPGPTLWEVWTRGGSGTSNHGWNGAPAMLSAHGLGARPTSPGWTTYDLKPQLGRLTRIDSTVPTRRGRLRVLIDASLAERYTMTVESPTGTVGRIGLPRLVDDPQVAVNGALIYQRGATSAGLTGLTPAGEDADYLYFSVTPGRWTFTVSGAARTVPLTSPPVSGWTACAPEGGLCLFDGTAHVRFGTGTSFVTAELAGGAACTVGTFGGDPAPGRIKRCEIEQVAGAPPGHLFCAPENGTCALAGPARVSYGASGRFNTLRVEGTTACSNAVFGDPVYGTVKACYRRTAQAWSLCAVEGGTCVTTDGRGVVRFGAGDTHVVRQVDGSTPCTSGAFGIDPLPGTVKQCSRLPLPPQSPWRSCATEGGNCAVTGNRTVAYGTQGQYRFRSVAGPIACTNAAFGGDPAPGRIKACHVD